MRGWSLLGVLGTAALLASCGGQPESGPSLPEHESAILITIDTFRADAFGAGGHPLVRTPHIDRFFRESVQFREAFSASATTLPSHTSILSGAWPTTHGVFWNLAEVPDSVDTFPEALLEAGISTGAFVSSVALDPGRNLGQGFEIYDFEPVRFVELDQPWRPAGRTLRRALGWWTTVTGRRFLWVHLFEPHLPYEPRPELLGLYDPSYAGQVRGDMDTLYDLWGDPGAISESDWRHLRSLYYAEITGLDRKIGRFLRVVNESPSTLVVLTADHGESLGEHGLYFKHGPYIYPADVAVPLAMRADGLAPTIVPSLVRTIDIAGTVLSLLGVSGDLPAEASDLLRSMKEDQNLSVFGLASMPWNQARAGGVARLQRVVRTSRAAYVETPWRSRKEWFDRTSDPGELAPGAPADPEYADALRGALDAWIDGARTSAQDVVTPPEVVEQLKSLGYTE